MWEERLVGIELGGADPVGKGEFNNAMGLMYDPDPQADLGRGPKQPCACHAVDEQELRRTALAE